MNYNKITAFLWLFFLSAGVYAQENFMPGFLIMPNGDTLRGEIDNQNWRINPEFICFKHREAPLLGYTTIHYGHQGICCFERRILRIGIRNLFDYVSRDVKETLDLQDRQNPHPGQCVCNGALPIGTESFAQLWTKKMTRFTSIIRKKAPRPQRLWPIAAFLSEVNGKSSIREVNVYKSQLSAAISNGCPSLSGTISGLNYNEKSLLAFVKAYNECVGAMAAYEKKVEKLQNSSRSRCRDVF